MPKVLNILFIILILFFLISTYKYYISNKNLKAKDFNRNNIDQIISEKIDDLPILIDDTNNVIEFNNSLSDKITNDKPRSFWNLLKSK
jgi:DNA-binding ferritin-like protein